MGKNCFLKLTICAHTSKTTLVRITIQTDIALEIGLLKYGHEILEIFLNITLR